MGLRDPTKWKEIRVADLGRVVTGRTPPGTDPAYYGGDIPFLTPSDMDGRRDALNTAQRLSDYGAAQLGRCLVPSGVGVSCIGWQMGKAIRIVRPTVTNQQINSIIVDDSVADSLFVYYSLLHRRQEIFNLGSGGSRTPILNKTDFERLPFALPPMNEQKAIAQVLGVLDDKIELNRRMNETLEAMARALFKSWFVDFDPVRAKAQGRKPAGLDPDTAKLFPKEFVDSDLGEIPKGWMCAPLQDWASALSGGTPSKSNVELWGGDLPWISPKVMTSIHADETDAFVTREAIGNGTRVAPAGATLIMVRGMGLHQEVRVSQARREVTFNQDVKALVPRAIEASLLLFAMLDAQEVLLGRVESSGHGTGKLPSEILLAHPIVMPPPDIQRHLAGVFTKMNDRIGAARTETRHLAALRDQLLPRLLSGELLVTAARRVLEAQA